MRIPSVLSAITLSLCSTCIPMPVIAHDVSNRYINCAILYQSNHLVSVLNSLIFINRQWQYSA